MERLVGLVAFTLGLALFVFPMAVVSAASDRRSSTLSHRSKVGVRIVGLVGMAVGFWLLIT